MAPVNSRSTKEGLSSRSQWPFKYDKVFFFISVDDRSGRSAVQWWKLEEIWLRAPTVADKQARPRPGGRFQLASRSHGGVVVVARVTRSTRKKKQQKRLDSSGAQRAGSVSLSPFSRLRSASARPARPRERDDGNATNSPSESDPPHPIVPPARCSATALARSPPRSSAFASRPPSPQSAGQLALSMVLASLAQHVLDETSTCVRS